MHAYYIYTLLHFTPCLIVSDLAHARCHHLAQALASMALALAVPTAAHSHALVAQHRPMKRPYKCSMLTISSHEHYGKKATS